MTYNEFRKQAGIGTVVAPGLVTYGGLYFGLEKVPALKKRRILRALIAATGGLGVSGTIYGVSRWLGAQKQKREKLMDADIEAYRRKQEHEAFVNLLGQLPTGDLLEDYRTGNFPKQPSAQETIDKLING